MCCCARMIRSARPLKPAQETMLAVIAMRPGRPDKAAILAQIKALDDEDDAAKAGALDRLKTSPTARGTLSKPPLLPK